MITFSSALLTIGWVIQLLCHNHELLSQYFEFKSNCKELSDDLIKGSVNEALSPGCKISFLPLVDPSYTPLKLLIMTVLLRLQH